MHKSNRTPKYENAGIALATLAASLFLSAPIAQAAQEEAIIHCAGVNACKGQGRCGSAEHACKGANACKGKGILPLTEKECAAQGGKPKELPAPK
ncbi:MAG: hypothetical protein HY081_00010 [Gammaproteobacteria bacterium]|nr:hypothetical protein [Gammaproteobacteria bacterium]